ncbi:MAG: terpene cyclase/mutase family protein [Planctomycetes bacterium]|nr:terpene cyclase/mutase family protein [Planctomycetota bacterium]
MSAMSTAAIVWMSVAVAAAAGLVVVVRTRWLQSRTLEKCVALSVGLHAVLAIVCAFVGGWAPASWGRRDEGRMTIVMAVAEEPSDAAAVEGATGDRDAADEPFDPKAAATEPSHDADEPPPPLVPLVAAAEAPAAPPDDHVPLLDAPPASESADLVDQLDHATTVDSVSAIESSRPVDRVARAVPATYADRVGERRAAAALARGGSEATEQAVQAGLRWLAAAQSADGRWEAARHGASIERTAEGRERRGAGGRTDHGVTGLALLAMLGAGNTHRDGPHAAAVDRGIRFLVGRQRPDGSFAGDAEFFAALYCHGMATIAVAECLAMTGDESLRPAVDRGVAHTLAMQHPVTGGWRYAAGDRGDTSQCGWQVMVLATARNAGLGGFDAAEARARTFLQSVASGPAGGLAAYRVGERPSMAMTAEALYCRLVLGASPAAPATAESLAMIASSPPTPTTANAYAWYYGTLASFHAGGPQWDRWNTQLQGALVSMQRRDGGPLDGSWDPDPVWGGHGGRVYSTALSAMTLEVYYRYQPLHERGQRMALAPVSAASP